MIRDFQGFLTRINAMAMAIGVIIGLAVGKVVSALVDDLLMPIVGVLLPSGGWRDAKYVLTSGKDAAGKVTENAILYGHLLGTIVDFLIVAFVVYLLVRTLVREAPPAPTRVCPECLEVLPLAARRCRACTAAVV
jgi:large conductance mechanosensitive channel